MNQPEWLDKKLYPFTSQYVNIEGQSIHYIDEGKGPVLLFVHGTPEWSFGYRDLIKDLRSDFRCVAIDLLGFGLSAKPTEADYSCQAHSNRLEKFIQALELRNITLVANDFGGGISIAYGIRCPENIMRVIIFNSWMWSLKNDRHYSVPAKIMNSWLGRRLYLNFGFPVNALMPSSFGDRKKLTKEIHLHYKNALPDADSRIATYAFAQELMKSSDWWEENWDALDRLSGKPFLLLWGLKDTFVQRSSLEKWKAKLTGAVIITFDDAGHFVQEEKPKEMISAIRAFMG